MMRESRNSHLQLGCGTSILIAIIVAIFSNIGTDQEINALRKQMDRIEAKPDALAPSAKADAVD